MASRNDVAKLAGVSPSVVSYVLNDSNYVSKEKREAVLAAIKELNYQPSYFGRALKAKRTNNLALICDDIRGELFSEIAFLVEKEIYQRGYNLFLSNSHKRKSFMQELSSHKFDGIFLATSVYTTEEINTLAASGTPVVLYEAHEYPDLDPRVGRIHVDYENGARLLTERLLDKGVGKIAFFPPYQCDLHKLGEQDYRFRGYLSALRDHGVPFREELVSYENGRYQDICLKAESICQKALENGEKLGFVVGSDYLAVQIMNYLRDRDLFVSGQVWIAGMDHTACSALVRPKLTTAGFDKERIARAVIRQLLPDGKNDRQKGIYEEVPMFLAEGASG